MYQNTSYKLYIYIIRNNVYKSLFPHSSIGPHLITWNATILTENVYKLVIEEN